MSYNSTIRPKIGDCDCGRTDTQLTAGKCHSCYWGEIRLKSARKQVLGVIPDPPDFRARDKAKNVSGSALGDWFLQRREEMKGVCCNCDQRSSKYSEAFFTFSIGHVLPKSKNSGFPSVSQHPDNWLEFCQLCHTRYDSNWETASKMRCFPLALAKFKIIEPFIAKEERRRIPSIFLK